MPLELGGGNDAKRKNSSGRCAVSITSMKWLGMYEPAVLGIALYVILLFVVFIAVRVST